MQDVGITAHTIPGVGTLKIRPQTVRSVYNSDAIDALVAELVAQNTDFTDMLAERIRACSERKTTNRI